MSFVGNGTSKFYIENKKYRKFLNQLEMSKYALSPQVETVNKKYNFICQKNW